MHEFSIMEKLFKIIEQNAKQNRLVTINKIYLTIGELCQINADYLKFAFNEIAKDTIAIDAELLIETIPGKDITLDSIEGEQQDENHH